ncbi:Uncharacterized conserved protein [Corynebacterium kutscheri]|uniref:Uncharacterized conserved protein n=1 Tax=Corynebacterium kutscheri TaxID=35755 RepID=A0A0F6R1H7_9CORY|nr:DUF262 domain-containing protein [Corynebacterium kutscheri]AKE41038.1 hypothetical protein UL82_04165 [Corynebacterium kutscheri]VEH06927.1 Uncharacterized conserved protein [Corynebacterium kutscheri]VEH09336.1 Uncharacterized conserved protein [Corynebacterium kutscheri]VEH79423.1 Uncharacterized conserved protein [Corynebacterium kutscheri]
MGFLTPSYDLIDLFHRIDRGDLQLPDFQRSFRWDVDQIRSLIVTVLRGYPMGSIMALDTRNEPMRFKPRPVEGAPDTGEAPGLLLLDGQQRLTTLYQALRGDGMVQSVDFRQKRVQRRYFIDIRKAVESDIMPDEAVISVNQNGEVKSHYGPEIAGGITSMEQAVAAGFLPLSALLSDSGTDLLFDFAAHADSEVLELTKRFHNQILKPLVRYRVPMIRLDRETAQAGIGSIFAQANSSGLQMDVFELLTAVFGIQDPEFSLKEDWAKTESVLRKFPALDGICQTDFLTAVALYVTAKNGAARGHREAILRLTLAEYIPAAEKMRAAFRAAAHFMAERCIITTDQVPYTAQLIPLAVIVASLSEEHGVLSTRSAWDRLNQWFWCGVFGELYGAASIKARSGADVDQVSAWIRAAAANELGDYSQDVAALTPKSVHQARFVESRLLSAGHNSGLYKGIYALIMGRGAKDWRTAQPFNAATFTYLGVHFRQIFPAMWCEMNDIDPVLAQSVLNRTPMSRRTHVMVEDSSPARYLIRMQSKSLLDDTDFDAILEGHLLDPKLILNADANNFFRDRRRRFVTMIEEAMGKPAIHDVDEYDLAGGEEGPNAFIQ